jgi:hypothetical protein
MYDASKISMRFESVQVLHFKQQALIWCNLAGNAPWDERGSKDIDFQAREATLQRPICMKYKCTDQCTVIIVKRISAYGQVRSAYSCVWNDVGSHGIITYLFWILWFTFLQSGMKVLLAKVMNRKYIFFSKYIQWQCIFSFDNSTAMYVYVPKNLTRWWDSNSGSFVLEADAVTTMPRRRQGISMYICNNLHMTWKSI